MSNDIMTLDDCRTTLTQMEKQMKMALPNHIPPEKINRVIITEVQKNPKILKCTRSSILTAVMEACQLGLVPNSVQGLAYLVPYGNRCQLITGYKGLISLALQSGRLASIWGRIVREGDLFEYEEGTSPYIKHKPVLPSDAGQTSARVKAAYAVAKMKGIDDTQFECLTLLDIERIKAKSAAGSRGPWKDDYDQMAKKTAVRQLLKWLPLESEKVEWAADKREGGSSGWEYNVEEKDFVYIAEDDSNKVEDLNQEFSA